MRVVIVKNYQKMSGRAAEIVKYRLKKKPDLVLGLATGSTPLGMYKELIRMHKEEGLDFSRVRTFNLDEYCGLSPEHPQSYHRFMWDNFFNHINIDKENVYIPRGKVENAEAFCSWYEGKIKEIGGVDLQILGIGRDGHIGFNEPGSSLGSRTRIKTLTEETMEDNARFFERKEDVPRYAITMGVGTILEAKECLLLASGEPKAEAIQRCMEEPISCEVTASALQLHPKVIIIVDEEAAKNLKRAEYYKYEEKIAQRLERRER
jgi:glucosamine-6-phosphate deaminase